MIFSKRLVRFWYKHGQLHVPTQEWLRKTFRYVNDLNSFLSIQYHKGIN